MLTALSEEEERVRGLSLGADDYLSKPYSVKELLLKIRKHIDRQQAINQIEARKRKQDTALRCMVHELRNSLTAIGGFSSRALRQDDSNTYLKTIKTTASHAENLLRDAPLLSRLEPGGEGVPITQAGINPTISEPHDFLPGEAATSVLLQQIDVASLISEIAETARILVGTKPVTVEARTLALSVMISTDKVRLRQILINLVSNAAKLPNRVKSESYCLWSEAG
jgi:signal transduction histidine kinase